jgi:pimeloyl-ACP methyl ester carboxylesterase
VDDSDDEWIIRLQAELRSLRSGGAPVTERRAVIDGVELSGRVAGSPEGRPIVLLHGLTANSDDWSFTVRPLSEAGWRVLAPDLPGHGRSSAPNDPVAYRMERVADLMHGFADELDFSPAVVVGNSMGGAVAQEWVLRHPESVSALVLVGSAGDLESPPPAAPEDAALAERERALFWSEGAEAVWELHQKEGGWLQSTNMPPEVAAWGKERFCGVRPEANYFGRQAVLERRQTLADLAQLSCKTLVICGETEPAWFRAVSDRLAATIPAANYEIIPAGGHCPQWQNTTVFNAILLRFLAAL